MEETLIYKAASSWNSISAYKYSFIYGYKCNLYTINLSFLPNDFPHLAGFQYLKDLSLPLFTPSQIVSRILDGTITQEQIEKGSQYENLVKPRLVTLSSFERILDNDFTLYSFIPRHYSFYTNIKADFLISSHIDDVNFVFLIRQGEPGIISEYSCCSSFTRDEKDYEQNQRSRTILQKTKTRISDNSTQTLFVKDGYKQADK